MVVDIVNTVYDYSEIVINSHRDQVDDVYL